MKTSRLIEILAQYLQQQGDLEVVLKKWDVIMKDYIYDDLDEMDLNVKEFANKRLVIGSEWDLIVMFFLLYLYQE